MLKLNIDKKVVNKKTLLNNTKIEIPFNNGISIIFGESGCGKSTLLNMIKGIDRQYSGFIELDGDKIISNTNDVVLVLQHNYLLEELSVLENLLLISNNHDEIIKLLDVFGLLEYKEQIVSTLSGGQRQRVCIIRGLIQSPKLLILDEPTTGLDDDVFNEIIKYLELTSEYTNILIATHDIRFEDFNYETYYMEDKNIFLEKTVPTMKKLILDRKITKTNFWNSIELIFKNNISNILKKSFIFLIISTIFIILLNNIFFEFSEMDQSYTTVLSDDIIYIDSEDLKEIDLMDKYYFGQDDLDFVESIDGVSDVLLTMTSISFFIDNDGYQYEEFIDATALEIADKYPSFALQKDPILLTFESLSMPYEFHDDVEQGNNRNLEIVDGDYPHNDTNEILIPDFIFYNLELTEDLKVGDFYTLDVKEFKEDGSTSIMQKDYIISGYYKTEFQNHINDSYKIYLNYSSPLIDTGNKMNGLQADAMFIRYDMDKKESVYDQLSTHYDNYNIYDSSNVNAKYNFIKTIMLLNYSIYGIIFGSIATLLCFIVSKFYYSTLEKQYAILYLNGYSKSRILFFNFIIELSAIVFIFIIAYIITYFLGFLNIIIFIRGSYKLFNLFTLISTIVFFSVSILISQVNVISMLKNKKLIKNTRY